MKLIQLVLIPLVFAGFAFVSKTSQNDPKAKEILDAMSKKYQEMKSYKADFTYALESGAIKESTKGQLWVKGNKYKLVLGDNIIFNDGKNVWNYTKGSTEALKSTYHAEDDEYNPTKIYTMYQKGFKYLFVSDQNDKGVIYSIVDLEPSEVKKSRISKVRMVINKKDKSIKSWKIIENNGSKTSYTVTSFSPNVTVADAEFTFDKSKYPEVKQIIELD